ncbi:MAG: hypothetical protein J0L82_16725 [Deltaproteobacteria bacterium]|jgi:hypothetical protein|nr:hypothetical protein [Deltaproteobacteria bacterium]
MNRRHSDLPSDLPADAFYEQIKVTNQRLAELRFTKQDLASKATALNGQTIDRSALIEKVKAVVERLEVRPALRLVRESPK